VDGKQFICDEENKMLYIYIYIYIYMNSKESWIIYWKPNICVVIARAVSFYQVPLYISQLICLQERLS
jgi:hypothetical protein